MGREAQKGDQQQPVAMRSQIWSPGPQVLFLESQRKPGYVLFSVEPLVPPKVQEGKAVGVGPGWEGWNWDQVFSTWIYALFLNAI